MYNNSNALNTHQTMYHQNLGMLKNFLQTPLTLVLAILFLLDAVLYLINDIIRLVKYTPAGSEFASYRQSGDVLTTTAIYAVFLFFIIAAFLIHTQSKNVNPNASPIGGIRIFWVFSIITLIFSIIISLILITAAFMSMNLRSILEQAFQTDEFKNIITEYGISKDELLDFSVNYSLFISIALLLMSVFILICGISFFRSMSSLKRTAGSTSFYRKGFVIFGIIMSLGALNEICPLILNYTMRDNIVKMADQNRFLKDMGMFQATDINTLLVSLTAAGIFTVCAILAFSYNKYAKNIINKAESQQNKANPAYINAYSNAQFMRSNGSLSSPAGGFQLSATEYEEQGRSLFPSPVPNSFPNKVLPPDFHNTEMKRDSIIPQSAPVGRTPSSPFPDNVEPNPPRDMPET